MIYDCFCFYGDYYRIDEIKSSYGLKYYKLYNDADEMNCPFGSSFNRSILKDCILKVEFDTFNETKVCNFYLGDFDNKGFFNPLIHFEENIDNVLVKFDDEKVDFLPF